MALARENGAYSVIAGVRAHTAGERDDAQVADPSALIHSGVTPREIEVLRAVQEHLSNAEIAARLFVSERTVASHVSSLLRKLQAGNRLELARLGPSLLAGADDPPTNVPAPSTTFIGRAEEHRTAVAQVPVWPEVPTSQDLRRGQELGARKCRS